MYTLDINLKKNIIFYIIISFICLVGSIIYLKLSFGVVSNYMKYVTIIPFVLGVIVNLIICSIKAIRVNRLTNNLYNAGVASLIFGSIVQGILEISGAHSFYVWAYLVLGGIFILSSLISLIVYNKKASKN